ncbi:carbamoyltransferase HypF [Schwartzia succinivorans]|jgi:hydrogenase maturation protein HypF|uniref:Carbamoyltransferase n=1 Tax=Schwartzia succinivorans DSM 10502 TaxID=1123243 RepID=A0A1M4X884_9FIRM|nr:carbamoyltransferase HypF [Schwartzia succinivorans]SHE89372.1 hydrogenase maturation protein HypF [Schwartzia succinivorans DSM 10502]
MEKTAVILRVYGIVQGVGFRPFVARLAAEHGLMGSVCNKGPYVEIYLEGEESPIKLFSEELITKAPPRSAILKVDGEQTEPKGSLSFEIIESAKERGAIFVSPDIATCPECKKELFDPKDRRYLHPFINCTACGPRLTILDAMPYDRERTSMKAFPMCERCAEEYNSPTSRRYDAQPVCCNDCGPEVYILGTETKGAGAITEIRRRIADGEIVAIKGIGGFHLCCDATNENAVSLLRERKHRPVKPFAVMVRDMEAARRAVKVTPAAEEILEGPKKPILLLERQENSTIAPSAAPGNPKIGIMLPYAPVQMLLFDYPDGIKMPEAFIMTSGNPSGAPICRTDDDAREALGPLCEAVLSHDRRIRVRADDSVMDFYHEAPYMIRRSRGYAPLPVMVKGFRGEVLALGGELKNTFCIGRDELFYPSAYVGDMSDLRTMQALRETSKRMTELLETEPSVTACDLHPRYNTTQLANELGKPVIQVQHHYAHVVSCMAENEVSEPVIGVSFDGTGYGTDGTVWGGEFLRADYHGFERLGSIEPFCQAGGDRSSKEGWRIAVNLLYSLSGSKEETADTAGRLKIASAEQVNAQCFMADNGVNCVTSTSAGRLFDAVSAVLGIRKQVSFEGEAAMFLEYAARNGRNSKKISLPEIFEREGRFILPTAEIFSNIVERTVSGDEPPVLARFFHEALADEIVAGCERAREMTGITTAALSGGVFQNLLLLELVETGLEEKGFRVLRHHLIPPNDGGICLGQAVYAMAQIQ